MLIAAGAKMVVDAATGNSDPAVANLSKNKSDVPEKPVSETPVIQDVATGAGGFPGGPDKPPKKDDDEKKDTPGDKKGAGCSGECDNKSCAKVEEALTKLAESEAKRADLAIEQLKTNSSGGWAMTQDTVATCIQAGMLGVMVRESNKNHELAEVKQENTGLKNDNAGLRRENANLKVVANKLLESESKYIVLEHENANLKQSEAELKRERDELKKRLAEIENENAFR
jgi:hypothetical protein